jgi:NAD(P)-dependent dehydrogenase (short-subunit alcohol dehydrogenase family)
MHAVFEKDVGGAQDILALILEDFMAASGERASTGVEITGRAGQPAEIAEVIRFLASPAVSWVTGCNIECDGGLTAQLEFSALRAYQD